MTLPSLDLCPTCFGLMSEDGKTCPGCLAWGLWGEEQDDEEETPCE